MRQLLVQAAFIVGMFYCWISYPNLTTYRGVHGQLPVAGSELELPNSVSY